MLRDSRETVDPSVVEVTRDLLDHMDHLVPKDLLEAEEWMYVSNGPISPLWLVLLSLSHNYAWASTNIWDATCVSNLAILTCREAPEVRVLPEPLAHVVTPGLGEMQEVLALREPQAVLDLQAHLDLMVHKVAQVRREIKVPGALQETRVPVD